MTLAPFVKIVAQGKGRARALSVEEAHDAMRLMLADDPAPEAIGALLMVLRLRGETPDEIAGFTSALQDSVTSPLPMADLDWPSYAAGRTRGAPLFLLSAKLVAQAGYRVSLHGWNSHQSAAASPREALHSCGLIGDGLTYAPLEDLCPPALRLLRLRDVLGLRSCINTVLRMWNPSRAAASVQGVFHPSYRGLQANAAAILGRQNLTIIKGGGGEFERHPAKTTVLFGLHEGAHFKTGADAISDQTRRLHDGDNIIDPLALWDGSLVDEFAIQTVTGTAALALWTLGATSDLSDADALAARLWVQRHDQPRIVK